MKTVNIVGLSTDQREVSFMKGEKWGVNHGLFWDVGFDKVFVMDGLNGLTIVREKTISREGIIERINGLDFTLITPFLEKGVVRSEAYPLIQVKEKYDILYFKNTFSYMLAYAALHGFEDVHLHGVNMSDIIAYVWERPSVEHWIGVLRGQGAKITSHDKETRLFGGRPSFGGRTLYGYEMDEEKALKKVKK